MAFRVMGAKRRKRAVGGSFDHSHRGIFFFHSRAHRVHIIHLDAEVIDAARIAGPPAQKCQADIAVGDDHRGVIGFGDSF